MTGNGWHFDLYSSIMTVVVIPIILLILGTLKRQLLSATNFILNGFVYLISASLTRAMSARFTLRSYCRIQLGGQSQYLHIPSHKNVALEIDKIFVPLVLERTGLRDVVDHYAIGASGNRVQIIGDPGSGKSTVIKRMFRDECKKALNGRRNAKLPILIELRNLSVPKSIKSTALGSWMVSYLRSEAQKVKAYRVDSCFDAYIKTAGLLVLLDGLDEVNTENIERIMAALKALSDELSRQGPSNVLVCTMRVQFYFQVKTIVGDFLPVIFSIRPFRPTDIYTFLHQWRFGDEIDNQAESMRVFNDLSDRPSLREMCTNPLILSMYVARDQAEGGVSPPESRTDFYMRVVEELIVRRRAGQIGAAQAQAVLKNQRLTILGRIAHRHLVESPGAPNSLPWAEVISVIVEVTKVSFREAEDYFKEMSKETGIISEEREREVCRFIHLTFCEFLAAYEATHGSATGWQSLLSRHQALLTEPIAGLSTRLVEVVPFACALLPRYQMPEAVTAVGRIHDRHTLTMAFLETKIYDHPIWYTFIENEEKELINSLDLLSHSQETIDRTWLSDIHLFIVVCKDEERSRRFLPQSRQYYDLDGFFQKLVSQTNSFILPMIAGYAQHDAVAASRVASLCHVNLENEAPEVLINGCDQPPFVASLVDQAQNEEGRRVNLARLLAEAGLRSPAARETLQSITSQVFSTLADAAVSTTRWHGVR